MAVKTRELILNAALELFNEHRSTNVTTTHIAREMGISPGNLYYYFRNKEEIIREIFKAIDTGVEAIYKYDEFGTSEEAIVDFYHKLAMSSFKYRFFFLEISVLVRNDPLLKEAYGQRANRILRDIGDVFDRWVRVGIMNPFPSEKERKWLIQNAWTTTQTWLTYEDLLGDPITWEKVLSGQWRLHSILRPYMADESKIKIDALLEKAIKMESV
ncbi:MAG: TetR/AcrR family transcriptional regulator [Ignavibacteriales bacterium]